MNKPYNEVVLNECIYRVFSEDVVESELIWHKDKRDRNVKVITGQKWRLQMENELPFDLEVGESYFIPKETYHRIIKGKGKLALEIVEE